jgi:putative ABC transport system permease protein
MTISLLGVEMEAEIASFRAINWDTMGFNFVLIFSPGSIESAPYTVSATIAAKAAEEDRISRAVGRAFPSVSIIKVKDVITQIGGLLTQMAQAIAVAATLAVLAGIAVLVGAIAASRQARIYDAVILKLQGATRFQVLGAQALEYGMLALLLSGLALALGAGAGWYIMTRIFEFGFLPDWLIVIATVALGGLLTLVFGLAGALPALAARPAAALRSL